MSCRMTEVLGGLFVACLSLAIGGPAWALEPINVTVEGVVEIKEGDVSSVLRQKAFTRALREAVVEVASRYLPPDRSQDEKDAVERALSEDISSFVLTYRLDGDPQTRPSAERPSVEEYVIVISATVDAGRLRESLQRLGYLPSTGTRPSLALFLELAPNAAGEFALEPLRQFLSQKLSDEGFVIVEPALYSGSGGRPRSAVELARSLGADVGVGIDVSWSPLARGAGSAAQGGTVEVRVRSVRARDALELASVRFEAPGYAPQPEQAFQKAVQGLQEQLASGVLFQLEQNLASLGDANPPVRVRLSDVSGLRQVERVQAILLDVLGAKDVRLAVLEPRSAELVVDSSLSPGALQERMVGAAYDGFELEPVQVGTDVIELRVLASAPQADGSQGAGDPVQQGGPQIDTGDPN